MLALLLRKGGRVNEAEDHLGGRDDDGCLLLLKELCSSIDQQALFGEVARRSHEHYERLHERVDAAAFYGAAGLAALERSRTSQEAPSSPTSLRSHLDLAIRKSRQLNPAS
jgi:hypothetical protein